MTKYISRGVFLNLSNIYDETFSKKFLNSHKMLIIFAKSTILDVW